MGSNTETCIGKGWRVKGVGGLEGGGDGMHGAPMLSFTSFDINRRMMHEVWYLRRQ